MTRQPRLHAETVRERLVRLAATAGVIIGYAIGLAIVDIVVGLPQRLHATLTAAGGSLVILAYLAVERRASVDSGGATA